MSKKYPEIDYKMVNNMKEELVKEYNLNTNENLQIDIAKIDIAFISSTRNDTKTDRSLCRGEFYDMIVRMANIEYTD